MGRRLAQINADKDIFKSPLAKLLETGCGASLVMTPQIRWEAS
jgi:hypothetical protein